MICKLKNLSKKQKAKAIVYGTIETIINAPKNIPALFCILIGAIFGTVSEGLETLANLFCGAGEFLKWEVNDLTIAPKELTEELKNAIKEQTKKI